jgi:hypothetical protein
MALLNDLFDRGSGRRLLANTFGIEAMGREKQHLAHFQGA